MRQIKLSEGATAQVEAEAWLPFHAPISSSRSSEVSSRSIMPLVRKKPLKRLVVQRKVSRTTRIRKGGSACEIFDAFNECVTAWV